MNNELWTDEAVALASAGPTPAAIAADFQTFIARFGYTHFCFGRIAPSKGGEIWIASQSPWMVHYSLNKYYRVDPAVRYLRKNQKLVTWSELRQCCDEEGRRMFERAGEYGLSEGMAVGLDLGPRGIAAVGIAGEDPDGSALERNGVAIMATYCAAKIARLVVPNDASRILTTREAQCLCWVAQGKSDWAIAKILGLSKGTVHGYIKTARQKLDCTTRAQAVSRARDLNELLPHGDKY